MSIENTATPKASGLVERAKAILLTPRAEWAKIDGEAADLGKLYMGYLVPLAALAAIASAIGWMVFGHGMFGFTLRLPLTDAIATGVTQFVMMLVGPFVFGYIINALATTFGSTPSIGQAHKLTIYSATAGLIGGIAMIFPPIGILAFVGGVYSLVLLYIGLPLLMKTPQDKRLGYFITAIVVAFVLMIVSMFILGAVQRVMGIGGPLAGGAGMHEPGKVEGKVKLPGGGEIDLSELDKAAKQMEAAQKGEGGGVPAVDPAKLQALLPDSLPGGFARTSVSSTSTGAVGAAQAEGAYTRGDSTIKLEVVTLGPMGAMTSVAGAMGMSANREDENGYQRTRSEGGRMVTEELDRSSGTAKYTIIGKNGAVISAEARGGAGMDDAKKALDAIGVGKVEALGAN